MLERNNKKYRTFEAQQVLLAMEQVEDKTFPNREAFFDVIEGWLKEFDCAQNKYDARNAIEQATILLKMMSDQPNEKLRPSVQQYNQVLEGWGRVANIKGAPQQAQKLLEEMRSEELIKNKLTIESFNAVLSTWANSREHLRGSAAEEFFRTISVPKNGETYRIMIKAWVCSNEIRSAFRATGHLMEMLRLVKNQHEQGEIKDMEPALEDYYDIFKSWKGARDKHAVDKALNVLQILEHAFINRYTEIRPDITILRYLLQTCARSKVVGKIGKDSTLPALCLHADKLLKNIWDCHDVPDTECFGAAIATYTNCAVDQGQDAFLLAKRADTLLVEMKKSVYRSNTVKVSTEHYNLVIKAYTATSQEEAAEAALKLLDDMEQANDPSILPDSDTYSLVLTVLTNSKAKFDKIEKGKALMSRARLQLSQGNERAKPDIFLYNALIQTCASGIPSEQTFKYALQIFYEIYQSREVEADSETFYWLLEASESLLEPGTIQFSIMEQLFNYACKAGAVDRKLLTLFRKLAPRGLFSRLVTDKAKIEYDGTRIIPMSWSQKILTHGLDKKKPVALTINGNFYVPKDIQEDKARNLRERINQKRLRGGRVVDALKEEI